MRTRRDSSTTVPLFVTAAISFAVNCALGAAVAARLIDTSGFRWLHHALYVTTCATTAVAVGAGLMDRSRESRRAAVLLAPAAVPLAAIPYAGTHTNRHPLVALAASPFIAAGLIRSLLPADRK